MAETVRQIVNRIFRDHRRYTGDGLSDEPVGAPLPVGDPKSGPFNPPKDVLRDGLGQVGDDIEAARDAALAAPPFDPELANWTQSGTGAVTRTVDAVLRDIVRQGDYDTLANAKAAAGSTRIVIDSAGGLFAPGEIAISRGGFYEGSLGHLNEPGGAGNNFAKSSENSLSIFRGSSSAYSTDMSYARTAQYIEVWNNTNLTADNRSVWGNPYKMAGIVVEHIAGSLAQGEINGAAFRAYSTAPPAGAGGSGLENILVGMSCIAQTNTGSGNNTWSVFGANIIAAQTSGNAPVDIVGIETDVLNSSSSAGLRPGQVGATNYTAYWAQSDAAGTSVQSDTAFLATHTSGSGGWRQILQAEGKINGWAVYLATTINDPGAKGIYVETQWGADTGTLIRLNRGSDTQFEVTGSGDNPVKVRVGAGAANFVALKVGANDSGGTGFRSVIVDNS